MHPGRLTLNNDLLPSTTETDNGSYGCRGFSLLYPSVPRFSPVCCYEDQVAPLTPITGNNGAVFTETVGTRGAPSSTGSLLGAPDYFRPEGRGPNRPGFDDSTPRLLSLTEEAGSEKHPAHSPQAPISQILEITARTSGEARPDGQSVDSTALLYSNLTPGLQSGSSSPGRHHGEVLVSGPPLFSYCPPPPPPLPFSPSLSILLSRESPRYESPLVSTSIPTAPQQVSSDFLNSFYIQKASMPLPDLRPISPFELDAQLMKLFDSATVPPSSPLQGRLPLVRTIQPSSASLSDRGGSNAAWNGDDALKNGVRTDDNSKTRLRRLTEGSGSPSVLCAILQRLYSLQGSGETAGAKPQRKCDAIAYALEQLSGAQLLQVLKDVISLQARQKEREKHKKHQGQNECNKAEQENERSVALIEAIAVGDTAAIVRAFSQISGVTDELFLQTIAEWCGGRSAVAGPPESLATTSQKPSAGLPGGSSTDEFESPVSRLDDEEQNSREQEPTSGGSSASDRSSDYDKLPNDDGDGSKKRDCKCSYLAGFADAVNAMVTKVETLQQVVQTQMELHVITLSALLDVQLERRKFHVESPGKYCIRDNDDNRQRESTSCSSSGVETSAHYSSCSTAANWFSDSASLVCPFASSSAGCLSSSPGWLSSSAGCPSSLSTPATCPSPGSTPCPSCCSSSCLSTEDRCPGSLSDSHLPARKRRRHRGIDKSSRVFLVAATTDTSLPQKAASLGCPPDGLSSSSLQNLAALEKRSDEVGCSWQTLPEMPAGVSQSPQEDPVSQSSRHENPSGVNIVHTKSPVDQSLVDQSLVDQSLVDQSLVDASLVDAPVVDAPLCFDNDDEARSQCLLQLWALASATPQWATYRGSYAWHCRRLSNVDDEPRGLSGAGAAVSSPENAEAQRENTVELTAITRDSREKVRWKTQEYLDLFFGQPIEESKAPLVPLGALSLLRSMSEQSASGDFENAEINAHTTVEARRQLQFRQTAELVPLWINRLDTFRQKNDPSFLPLTSLPVQLQGTAIAQFLESYFHASAEQLRAMRKQVTRLASDVTIGCQCEKLIEARPPKEPFTASERNQTSSSQASTPGTNTPTEPGQLPCVNLNSRRMMVMVCTAKPSAAVGGMLGGGEQEKGSPGYPIAWKSEDEERSPLDESDNNRRIGINNGDDALGFVAPASIAAATAGNAAADFFQHLPTSQAVSRDPAVDVVQQVKCKSESPSFDSVSDAESGLLAVSSWTTAVPGIAWHNNDGGRKNSSITASFPFPAVGGGSATTPEEENRREHSLRRWNNDSVHEGDGTPDPARLRGGQWQALPPASGPPRSEVPGVYWYRNRNGWVAQWFENGKNKHKFFAASVFGVDGAKQKAIAYRLMKLQEKKLKGW